MNVRYLQALKDVLFIEQMFGTPKAVKELKKKIAELGKENG